MTLGLTIPGVPVMHPSEEWVQTCYPMTGPAQRIEDIWQPLIHYTAALDLADGDLGEFDYQIIPFLQAANRDYWLNRTGSGLEVCGKILPGYALGYLFAVDWLGAAWELRGFKFKPAATIDHNSYTFPILFLTDRFDPASQLMMQTARAIWREARLRSGRSDFRNRPKGHRELCGGCTACPGDAILAQRDAGMLDLDYDGGDTMIPFKKAQRAYDSRAGMQADVDEPYRSVNTTLGPLAPGQTRKIFVGMAQNAQVILHSIGHGSDGFLKVSGDAIPPNSSLVNFNEADRVEDNSQCIAITDGSIWVTAGPATCDFIVEVAALW